jgi:Spy/CpxP family protein refolding chaperone
MSRLQHKSILGALGLIVIGTLAFSAGVISRPAAPTAAATTRASAALMDWLAATPQQRAQLESRDPGFADELARLRADLEQRRSEFAAALDSSTTSDNVIRARLEAVLSANAALERRIADYLLLARANLTAEQQRKLFGLAAEEVRRGGWRARQGGEGGRGRGNGYGGPPWAQQQQQGAAPQTGQRGRGWRGGAGAAPATPAPQTPAPQTPAPQTPAPQTPTTQPAPTTSASMPQEAIHALFDNYLKIKRTVRDLPDGVEAITTSADPVVAALIRTHVHQMKARLESGQMMRGFDPLFREIFAQHEKIQLAIQEIDGGVKIVETSKDPQVVLLIQRHANEGVSQFVARGAAVMHEVVGLPEKYQASR